MKDQNVREVLIDFMDWYMSHPIAMDDDVENDIDKYLSEKSINLNQSERQPVTDNKGNGSCDICGKKQSVLFITEDGRFCSEHVKDE